MAEKKGEKSKETNGKGAEMRLEVADCISTRHLNYKSIIMLSLSQSALLCLDVMNMKKGKAASELIMLM